MRGLTQKTLVYTWLAVASAFLTPAVAEAYEEQLTIALDAGYSSIVGETAAPRGGPGAGIAVGLGIGDAWVVQARYGYARHVAGDGLHVHVWGAEALYQLDVTRWVPYFGAGVDALGTMFQGAFTPDFAVHGVLGLDFLVNRRWIVGVEVRPYVLPLDIDDVSVDPVYITASARVAWVIDLF